MICLDETTLPVPEGTGPDRERPVTPAQCDVRATIVAAFGKQCIARLDDGEVLACLLASRHTHAVCGDRVSVRRAGGGRGVVLAAAPRRTVYSRSSRARTKVLAANITQVFVIVAGEPSLDDELLCRFLVAAANACIASAIVLNKIDLVEKTAGARSLIEPFRGRLCPVIECAAQYDASPLLRPLHGQRTLLVGQSGMGKSTLVKRLVPDVEVRTAEISRFLNTGKQTTAASHLYALDADTEIVDSPGVSRFGLAGMSAAQLLRGFPEFAPHAANCRFSDCLHLSEPQCAVLAAAGAGQLHPRRLALYQRMLRTDVLGSRR